MLSWPQMSAWRACRCLALEWGPSLELGWLWSVYSCRRLSWWDKIHVQYMKVKDNSQSPSNPLSHSIIYSYILILAGYATLVITAISKQEGSCRRPQTGVMVVHFSIDGPPNHKEWIPTDLACSHPSRVQIYFSIQQKGQHNVLMWLRTLSGTTWNKRISRISRKYNYVVCQPDLENSY